MALPQVFRSSSTDGPRPSCGVAARTGQWTACLLALLCLTADALAAEPIPETIVFNRDIRPILSDTCFFCHGPDQAKRKADLRLDLEAEALADHDGTRALVPGDLEASELYRRIIATDESERMPPADSGRHLDARQIELIKRWIEQGAKWQKHWSFIAPERPALPQVTNAGWSRNDIDRFILARLEREGLAPSPEADKTTLIRRVTLDLTGLPPTPGEVDAFLADDSNEAYEKVVDRLLKSPRFGERMAARWLDAARYADTNGYQSDGERHMWRWRDWVIGAYNRNLPFDQFTIEQIAGDLLPNPSLDQRIATGFNRNHRGNAEGGIIPEEYAVEYVVDRVDTTSTVWLGLTMGCARCHDHKFDPLTQKEFYQLFAMFNNVPERGKAVKFGNSPPLIKAPTPEQQAALAALQHKLDAAEKAYADLGPQVTQAQAAWEQAFAEKQPVAWTFTEDLLEQFAFDDEPQRILEPAATPPETVPSGTSAPPKAANEPKPEPGFQAGMPVFGPGRIGQAAEFDGQRFVNAGNVADLGYYDKFTIAAWVYPTGKLQGTLVSRMTDTPQGDGYYVQLQDGKVQVNLIKRWLDDAVRVESETPLAADRWQHVLVTYDGSRVARGVQIYVDGAAVPMRVNLDDLNQPFNASEPLRIGAGNGPDGRFQGRLDDVRLYRRALTPSEAELVATPDLINEIVAVPAAQRTPAQVHKLHAYFLAAQAPEPIHSAHAGVIALRAERVALLESFPTTMVMEELPTPRETHLLLRGEYDKPGERVAPGVPASLGTLPAAGSHDRSHNRLDFARWLVDPAHPLTARVAVNRYWQMFFGTGLVKTVDDFGSQGEWPSHPELLDWLATEFIRTGWNVKEMHKQIAMSATYRQASRHTSELAQRDPDNRFLARGPRIRLSAEMIRDQALFASGLLVENVGGPSVLPYQPAGLWKELTGTDFIAEHGDKLYRRSLYIYWKRTIAPPSMMTFDASPRETCVVRETRTNTPLQALTLMNEVTFVEAARVLAQRVLKSPAKTDEERLTLTFRLVTGRGPSSLELAVLRNGLRAHRERFGANPDAARDLISAGEAPRDEQLNPAEHAAYAALAGLILNLDETVTNE